MVTSITSSRGEAYLSGHAFTDYGTFVVEETLVASSRIEYIVESCRDKSIIHIGFCDHEPLLEQRIKDGLWLHEHLMRVGKRCCGIDINEQAVANIVAKTGIGDLHSADVTVPELDFITSQHWDIAVLPDVIEHIPNPAAFLSKFVGNYGPYIDEILISVPNVQRLGSLKGALLNNEKINSDHCAEYSAYTLAKLARAAGVDNLKFCYCPYTRAPLFKRWILSNFPRFADSLIVRGTI